MSAKANKLEIGPKTLIALSMAAGLSFGSVDALYSTLLGTVEFILPRVEAVASYLADLLYMMMSSGTAGSFAIGCIAGWGGMLGWMRYKKQ